MPEKESDQLDAITLFRLLNSSIRDIDVSIQEIKSVLSLKCDSKKQLRKTLLKRIESLFESRGMLILSLMDTRQQLIDELSVSEEDKKYKEKIFSIDEVLSSYRRERK